MWPTRPNAAAFGRPGASRGRIAFPQLRFVSLVENGTPFASEMAGYGTSEARPAIAGMLCLADRQFVGFALWSLARGRGADLLWRVKKNMRLVPDRRCPTALT